MTSLKNKSSKRFKILQSLIVAVVFAGLFLVGKYTIPRFPFGPYFLYADLTPPQKADVIPYNTLTTEDSHPFVHSDKNYPFNLHGQIRARKNRNVAVNRFPETHSCLTKATRDQQNPDLRLLDWDAFQSLQDVEVCFWRIFSSLGTPEKVEKWLYFHNAKTVDSRTITSQNDYTTDYIVDHHLRATWSNRGNKSLPYPSKGIRLFEEGALSRTVSFTCFWDNSGQLRSVSARWGAVL